MRVPTLLSNDSLVRLSAASLPPTAQVRIDGTVLTFTLLISVLTGVLFGLAPALRTRKLNLSESLKEGGRSASVGAQRNRTRSVLVVFESAIAVVLLIGAGLLIRSLIQLQNTSPGFDAHNVLTMRVDLPEQKYATSSNFFAQLESRVGSLPGVESVGLVSELPLSGQPNDMPYTVEGRPALRFKRMLSAPGRIELFAAAFDAMRPAPGRDATRQRRDRSFEIRLRE